MRKEARFGFLRSSVVVLSTEAPELSLSDSSIFGQTTNTWCPFATSSATLSQTLETRFLSPARTTCEAISFRPAGSSVSEETAMSPKTVTAKVLGIGVAVMVNT